MLLWALARLEDWAPAWRVLEALGAQASALSVAPLLAACERQGSSEEELRLLRTVAGVRGLEAAAANSAALCLLRDQRLPDARRWLCSASAAGHFDEASVELWCLCGGARAEAPPVTWVPPPPAELPQRYAKELRLLGHVLARARPADAASVCAAIEEFGLAVLAPAGQWLKIAGGPKAKILAEAVRDIREEGAVLEVGTYCGFSALTLALALPSRARVTTIEADPVHVAIARSLVALAGRSATIEVLTGHSMDVLEHLPQLRRRGGEGVAFDAAFLDQRGARFGCDLEVLERLGLLRESAVVVADNVLKPGAPAFLWHVCRGGAYDTRIVSVREFAMPDTEDWMSVSRRRGSLAGAEAPQAPPEVGRLEREAGRMRLRAQGQGPGVSFAEWAAFAERMRRGLAALAIRAT